MGEVALKWQQVNAWRLAQHCLSPRLSRRDFVQAVTRTGGIQAQVMSAAEMALGARVEGFSPQDVQTALWQERTLVKTWAMRATLHLITASELPLYVAARSLDEPRNWPYFFSYHGVNSQLYEAYLSIAPEILGSEPVTRERFAAALFEQTGSPELQSLIQTKGWGTPLKPLAWRGDLCFGLSQGRNVTFVNPRKWIGKWQSVEPYAALQEIARRYLRAYGPATPELFASWWGLRLTPTRKLFKSLEAELEAVNVEGWSALALVETLDPMQRINRSGSVNLLPLFDAYVVGIGRGADIEPLLAKDYHRLVYRPQGWIAAVVLVDGRMQGTWETQTRGTKTLVKVHMFSTPAAAVKKGIEAEAERLSAFLNTQVMLQFEQA